MESIYPAMDYLLDFKELEFVGNGRFGRVYKVSEKRTGCVYAAKHIACSRASEKRRLYEEINILRDLEHPVLLKLHFAYQDSDNIIQVLEFLEGKELFQRIIESEEPMTEQHISGFVHQILTGLEYLHARRIVHLDLKPENIVCQDMDSFKLKIIDFGLARRLGEDETRVMEGTTDFVSPEVVNFDPVSVASDMWSLGVLTYVLLSGLSPFRGDTKCETLANITSLRYTFEEKEFEPVSGCGKEFICSLLVVDPLDRLSAGQALQHPWPSGDHSYREELESSGKSLKSNLKLAKLKWIKVSHVIAVCHFLTDVASS